MPNRDGTGPCGNRLQRGRRRKRQFNRNQRNCVRRQECLRENIRELEE